MILLKKKKKSSINTQGKHFSSPIPRLSFTPSLQAPLLPPCYHCRAHWGPSRRQQAVQGLRSGHSSFSLLLFPKLQSSVGCSLFGGVPASVLAHPSTAGLLRKYLLQCGSSTGSSYFGNHRAPPLPILVFPLLLLTLSFPPSLSLVFSTLS